LLTISIVMGEAAYRAGQASRLPLRPAGQAAFQAGRNPYEAVAPF
jgi:hypothetical protein